MNSTLKKPQTMNRNQIFTVLLSTLAVALFAFASCTVFISHSEFWSIAIAKIFLTADPSSISTYYRPLFNGLLKSIYWLPLDNTQHIVAARFIFSLLASGSFLLMLKNVNLMTQSKTKSCLFGLFLISTQIYFYNAFRVRSDIMAMLFLTAAYTSLNLAHQKGQWTWRSYWIFIGLCVLAFLTTPKAVYVIASLHLYGWYLCEKKRRSMFAWQTLVAAVGPLMLLFLFFGLMSSQGWIEYDPYALALSYYLKSLEQISSQSWVHLKASFDLNPIQYLLILVGITVFSFQANLRQQQLLKAQFLLFFLTVLILLIHPERWSYFLASLFPFLSLPVLFLLVGSRKRWMAGLFVACLVFPNLWLSQKNQWLRSNEPQLRTIRNLKQIYAQVPNAVYFDSTGLLPRERGLFQFFGPNEEDLLPFSMEIIETKSPEFIFFTAKMNLAKPDILLLLNREYVEVAKDIWVREDHAKDITVPAKYTQPSLRELFIFDYLPLSPLNPASPF